MAPGKCAIHVHENKASRGKLALNEDAGRDALQRSPRRDNIASGANFIGDMDSDERHLQDTRKPSMRPPLLHHSVQCPFVRSVIGCGARHAI